MTDDQWATGQAHALGIFLNGDGIPNPDRRGRRPRDDSFLLLINPTPAAVTFVVPDERYGTRWTVLLDTAAPEVGTESVGFCAGQTVGPYSRIDLYPHSLRLLIRRPTPTTPGGTPPVI